MEYHHREIELKTIQTNTSSPNILVFKITIDTKYAKKTPLQIKSELHQIYYDKAKYFADI